jgi:hypothetical protein
MEGLRRGAIDLRRRQVHGTKAAPISDSTRVKIAIVTWRKQLVAATARTFARPTGFRRNGATVTMKAVHFFHDVSQYRGGPVTPSKVSMVIICP